MPPEISPDHTGLACREAEGPTKRGPETPPLGNRCGGKRKELKALLQPSLQGVQDLREQGRRLQLAQVARMHSTRDLRPHVVEETGGVSQRVLPYVLCQA